MREFFPKSILTSENFYSNVRSVVAAKLKSSTPELSPVGGYTVFNPELKSEIFDRLRSKFRSTLYNSKPDPVSHFVGGFADFDKLNDKLRKGRKIFANESGDRLTNFSQKIHHTFAYLPCNFEANLSLWQSNPQAFIDFIEKSVSEGNVDPALVAKGALIRVFIYTMGRDFKKFIINEDDLLQFFNYSTIELSNGKTMELNQLNCGYTLDSNPGAQLLNTTPFDLPLNSFSRSVRWYYNNMAEEQSFFIKTNAFHVEGFIKSIYGKNKYGLELAIQSDTTTTTAVDVVPFVVDTAQTLLASS